jgi:hypothetical protein
MSKSAENAIYGPVIDVPKTVPYTGKYPDIPEFQKPWEFPIVGQGLAGFTEKGSLVSEGFGNCCAVVLKDVQDTSIGMIHAEPNSRFLFEIEDVLKNKFIGATCIFFIGSQSEYNSDIRILLEEYQIKIVKEISLNTGTPHWAVAYNKETNLIYVDNKSGRELQIFEGL